MASMHCRWMWVQIKKYRPGPEWLRLSSHGALLVVPWLWLSQLITFALVSTCPTWSCNLSLAEPSFFPCFLPSSPLIIGKVMVFCSASTPLHGVHALRLQSCWFSDWLMGVREPQAGSYRLHWFLPESL